jgi:hypothetical protein
MNGMGMMRSRTFFKEEEKHFGKELMEKLKRGEKTRGKEKVIKENNNVEKDKRKNCKRKAWEIKRRKCSRRRETIDSLRPIHVF